MEKTKSGHYVSSNDPTVFHKDDGFECSHCGKWKSWDNRSIRAKNDDIEDTLCVECYDVPVSKINEGRY